MKIGSLFDGSGGFPLAASMCGIKPVWASEVEPYPIAVTRSRFQNMKHLGSVTDVKGDEVGPVDVITFGSPCQDLSVAGKRAGLKHTENGDEETTRSGLFMEAIRIIKEMRNATNGEYPRYAIWENVPGAFSSNKGLDFRVVLEEFVRVAEPTAVMPDVPKAGWPYADVYCGDGWSVAYRVLDAQYWGVPQRRRRIYLVADFRGQRAGKVLFEREGLRGYFAESGSPWKAIAGDAESGSGAADRETNCLTPWDVQSRRIFATDGAWPALYGGEGGGHGYVCMEDANGGKPADAVPYTLKIRTGVAVDSSGKAAGKGALIQTNKAATLAVAQDQYLFQPVCSSGDIAGTLDASYFKGCGMRQGVEREYVIEQHLFENHSQDSRYRGPLDVCPMLPAQLGTGGNNQPFVVEGSPVYCLQGNGIDRAFYNQGQNAQYEPQFYTDGTVPTLVAKGPGAVAVRYIVRRLTPTECARLQGFPDEWGHPDVKESFSDEEYQFWLDVRNTHAAINGKATKDYTRDQMLTWYNKLHTDSSEYKMWGNGIALPCALYVMEGIADEPRN